MSTNDQYIIAVFTDTVGADEAELELQRADFQPQRIASSEHLLGGFLVALKNIFTRHSETGEAHEVQDLHITDAEVQYYEQEIQNGHTVMAVPVDVRVQQARDIVHSHGATTNYPLYLEDPELKDALTHEQAETETPEQPELQGALAYEQTEIPAQNGHEIEQQSEEPSSDELEEAVPQRKTAYAQNTIQPFKIPPGEGEPVIVHQNEETAVQHEEVVVHAKPRRIHRRARQIQQKKSMTTGD